jgi:fumarylacetoacetase
VTVAASWVDIPNDSDFTLANLPFGIATKHGWSSPHVVIAVGRYVFDCNAALDSDLLGDLDLNASTLATGSLNELFAQGREPVSSFRCRVAELLRSDNTELQDRLDLVTEVMVPRSSVTMQLPFVIGDYVDFYSSEAHATNLGKMFRPQGDPLLPNWKQLPVGYHGRSGTIVPSGTDVCRPRGIVLDEGIPTYSQSKMLDFELEVGTFVGLGSALGESISTADAANHIAGFVLFNDWTARDIQTFEYQPLGPNLAKSFLSSISPWVVTLDAVEPYLVHQPRQDPLPVRPLRAHGNGAIDIHLEVSLSSALMRESGLNPVRVSKTNFSEMYWTWAQQLAHITANGASTRTGDFYASGTVSGTEPDSYGSLIEMTWRGERPLVLPTGEVRAFLEDGDEVNMRGWCGKGPERVGLGKVSGRVLPARE